MKSMPVVNDRREWLDTDEAQGHLRYRTKKALYQAVRRGIIPSHRLGARRLRFLRQELDAVLLNKSLSDPKFKL
jgi:hypothetical protein